MIRAGEVLGMVKDYQGHILEVAYGENDGVILYQTGSLQVEESGPMIAYGKISREKDNRKEWITNYWKKRSSGFKEQRKAELNDPIAERWQEEIEKYLPQGTLRILDVGCGTGLFTILLSKMGHEVTGTDLTPDMIRYARELAEEENAGCQFLIMDGESLAFEDESFDVVISRNLPWTLPDMARAYKDLRRVRNKCGFLRTIDDSHGA